MIPRHRADKFSRAATRNLFIEALASLQHRFPFGYHELMARSLDGGAIAVPTMAPAVLSIEFSGKKSVLKLEAASYRVGRAATNQLSYPASWDFRASTWRSSAKEPIGWPAIWAAPTEVWSTENAFPSRAFYVPGDRITAGQVTLVYREDRKTRGERRRVHG